MTTKPLSTIDAILEDFYGEQYCGRCEDHHGALGDELNDAKAQLRSLVEKKMYELIGDTDKAGRLEISLTSHRNELRAEQRQNVPKLLDQIFDGENKFEHEYLGEDRGGADFTED